ncbi:hypothetical protein ACFQZV_07810 [Microbacterium koreense]|uniref:ABC-2 type transport system permease protein n=1 Tax=Microbacterium koreense TaxID=323761 RepID=A0ABW2ZRD5_9MICO
MAAHVLRLRLALLVGALRGGVGHAARAGVGLIVLAAAVIAACWALTSLADGPADVLFVVTVLAGSALTLGFVLAPVIAGGDDPLDPRRFGVLALGSGSLAATLVLAGFLSVPILSLIVVSVAGAVAWGEQDVAWTIGVLSVVLGSLTCVLFARVCFGLSALFVKERRSRELTGLFGLAIVVIVVPTAVFVASQEWNGQVPVALADAAAVLALTPLGAAWALPGEVAEGGTDSWLVFGMAALTVAALWFAWRWTAGRLLSTTERPVSVRERAGLGWFSLTPGTPAGAIAARSLLYWSRDRRYLVNLVVVPIAAVVTVIPLLIAGVPFEIAVLVPVPFAALFLGWLPHNDLAYDSSAVWMHIAGGVHGVADRVGRLVPVLLLGVPLLAVAVPVVIALNGDWRLLPALAGVSVSLFFAALGLSSIASVVAPYAVSRPGESPFQQPQRTGSGGAIAQALVMVGSIAVSTPVLLWAWEALIDDPAMSDTAMWGGIGIGLGVLIVGVAIGALAFSRRAGRIMEFAEST